MNGWIAIKLKVFPACSCAPDEDESQPIIPFDLDEQQVHERLLQQVRRQPPEDEWPQSRWTLAMLMQQCQDWFPLKTPAGMYTALRRFHIHYKRARSYIHSNDACYQAKVRRIEHIKQWVEQHADTQVLLYEDEMTYYRQPSLARAYEASGSGIGPKAHWSLYYDDPTRVVGTLDHRDGRVVIHQGSKIGISQLVSFYEEVVRAYPNAERIWIVQDNSFTHFHPDVLEALEPQESPFPFKRGKHWPEVPSEKAVKRWKKRRKLPIQLVQLPTQASWLNPIEKLWRKAKQDLIHLHRCANTLQELRDRVLAFFQGFEHGSRELLRYVGLLTPS